jgi:hypothetical protein
MSRSRWFGPGAVAFLVLWVVLLTAGRSSFFHDPGTFWHTTTGEKILSDGFIRTDPYSFTFGGTWWVPYQWLGEVAMALAHRAGGFDTELLGAVTIVSGVFAWLTTRLLRTGLHPVAVGMVILLGLAAAASHFHVRPHLFTILGMALTAAALTDFEAGRSRFSRLGWLVPFFVVWSNVHGGVLGGIATVALAAFGWAVYWQLGLPSPVTGWKRAALVAAVTLGCGLAPLVNPYGLDLIYTWQVIMGEPALKQIIVEHAPVDVTKRYAWPILAFAAVYLVVLAGTFRWGGVWAEPKGEKENGRAGEDAGANPVSPPGFPRVTWLLPLVWLVMAFDRVRHAPLFVVVGLVAIASMWPHTRWARWLARNRPDYQKPLGESGEPLPRTPLMPNVLLPCAAVLTAFLLQVAQVPVPVVGSGWARFDPADWPVEVLDVVKANEPRLGEPNHVFNDYKDGGYLIYHAPGYKVFVDDRCEVYGGPWLTEFVSTGQEDTPPETRAAAIAKWEADYGRFDFALTRAGTGYDDYFKASPQWECLKKTDTAAFYRRRKPPG